MKTLSFIFCVICISLHVLTLIAVVNNPNFNDLIQLFVLLIYIPLLIWLDISTEKLF